MSMRQLMPGEHLLRKGDFSPTYPICYVAEGTLLVLGHQGQV
jgi:hypothetical protein